MSEISKNNNYTCIDWPLNRFSRNNNFKIIISKKEIQQRVLQDGKPLDLNKFEWDEETNTFSSNENGLVLDFKGINGYGCGINGCTTSSDFIFNTDYYCPFNTGYYCIFDCEENCVIVRRVKGYTKLEPEETIQIGDHTYSKSEVEKRLQGLKEIK